MATTVGEKVHIITYQDSSLHFQDEEKNRTAIMIDDQNSLNTSPPPYSQVPGTVPIHQGRGSGPPPSYDEVVNPNDCCYVRTACNCSLSRLKCSSEQAKYIPEQEAPPPTYQSLFGQVREARKNSSGVLDFIRKVIVLILGTLGCSVVIGITVVIPFSMIIIGSSYIDACPAENKIPIYLIVAGVFGVVKNLLNFWSRCRKNDEEDQLKQNPRDTILTCFLFAWFIAGCVWIYKIYEPEYDDISSPYYCNKTVYLFSFWLVTSVYIILGLLTGCLCCLTVSSVFSSPE